MILKYRTTSLTSPPHTSYSYIDNISHFSPSYNPITSTLTINITLRTPYHVPTSLVLNDLAFLLTDDGKFLDKIFDPNSQSNSQPNQQYHSKPYKQHYQYNKPYYKKPYYKGQYPANVSSQNTEDTDNTDSIEESSYE